MIFVTAFLTGLLGSFHCAGMCGPIALATPTVGVSTSEKVYSKLVYNLGRMLTYGMLGAIFGVFGLGLKLAGWQQTISIVAGVVIITTALLGSRLSKFTPQGIFALNASRMGRLFQHKTYSALLGIGLLNGLLPCGFVYIGLIGSVATQDVLGGSLFMLMFGLGMLLMMFSLSIVGQFLTQSARSRVNKVAPYIVVMIGCLFILRGLNLGIPYVSPQLSKNETTVTDCCAPIKETKSLQP
jgi:uncharacterized protein